METAKTEQKLIQSNGQSWLLVEVPEGAQKLILIENSLRWKIDPLKFWWDQTMLVPGSYTLYGKGDQLSEEQWREIVEEASNEYYTGGKDYSGNVSAFHSFTESGKSWLTHHQFKPNGCVIIKVVK